MNPETETISRLQIEYVVSGYDRRKQPATTPVRPLMREELEGMMVGETLEVVGADGRLRNVKLNGKVRRWKRDAKRIEIPVKYGMYEYATFGIRADGRIGNSVAYLVVSL